MGAALGVLASRVLLPYPMDNLVLDVVLLLLFLALEILCIFYGWKGNLCECSLSPCVSLFILLPCAALAVYYRLLQTFILRLEFLLSAVLLCFYGLEFLLGLLSIATFSR
ncbi:transmembrane protein 216-like [Parambassis ranga]|uniref:Transmembrane protein 216 n=1 Tax=Parambassis ranga TaxID=210632 RepID=A0A6P7HWV3_9TELE|nr:transmembrane protein 216-like [Parambassis ranga]